MKFQIVITSPRGDVADTFPVVNGASLALAPGENVILLDEKGEAAKFELQVTGGDSLVTFENGEWVKLMNYSFAPAPSPLTNSASVVAIAAASAAGNATPGDVVLAGGDDQLGNDNSDALETNATDESESPMAALQNDAIPVSFGAGGGDSGAGDSTNSVVGAIATDSGFTLIRKSAISQVSFSNIESAELSTPQNGGATNQQGEDAEPPLLVRETQTIRGFTFPERASNGPSNAAPPIAFDDSVETGQSSVVAIPILDNDFDPDGDGEKNFSILVEGTPMVRKGTPITLSSGATIRINGENEIEYDPGDHFVSTPLGGTAIDTFNYVIIDKDGESDSATVSIQINGENDLPKAEDDPVEMDDNGEPLKIPVLNNDSDPDGDPLTVTAVVQPNSGATVIINPDGTITYDPDDLFIGLGVGETATDTFTYVIDDGNGGTDTATVLVTINGINDDPIATPDEKPVEEDEKTNIPIIENDDDPNGDDLCVSHINGTKLTPGNSITLASGATITLKPDFSVDYDTSGAFNALQEGSTDIDTFEYTLCDEHGGSTTSTVTVTIEGKNDPPVAVEDEAAVDQDSFVDIDVLANDYDPDEGDTISVKSVSLPKVGGILSINADGTVRFDTNGDFTSVAAGETAVVEFDYVIEDNEGATAEAPVAGRIVVNGINDAPDAIDDSSSTFGTNSIDIDVLSNDFDPDTSDTLTVSGFVQPSSGASVSINPDGTVKYDPGTTFENLNVSDTAIDTFSYSIDDGNGGSDSATVTVTIRGMNLPPVATDDAVPVSENGLTLIPVLENDTDPNGDDLTVENVTQPPSGAIVTIGNDGTLRYDPNGKFESLAVGETVTETFTYVIRDEFGSTDTATVTVSVEGANDAPAAANDFAITTESSAVEIPVLANDTDPDTSDTHVVTISVPPASGAIATVNQDGSVSYDPNGNFEYLAVGETASETFQYKIDDQNGGTDFANVTVTIQGENDAPVAVDDNTTTSEDNEVDIDVVANDIEVDATDVITITGLIQPPSSGAVVTLNPNGTVKYDPNGRFDPLATGETATDTFSYIIDDGNGGTDTATVTVVIVGTNDQPVAVDDSQFTGEDSSVLVEVLNNDFDPDTSNPLDVISLTQPGGGSFVVVNSSGIVDYDPNGKFEHLAVGETATDIFTYTINDGNGNTDVAEVIIVINGENDAPDATDDVATTNEDLTVEIDILANDADIDSTDVITISTIIQPTSGAIVSENSNGTVQYDPNDQFEYLANGETALDTFVYTIDDGNGGTASATATVTIFGINDAPVLADDFATTTESAPVTIDILENDDDPDISDNQVITLTAPTGGGTATLNLDNTVTFSPNGNYEYLADGESATDVFTYKVDDENGGTDTATVTVTILGENDAPNAVDDVATTDEESTVNLDIMANDSDIDATDSFSVTEFNGNATFSGVLVDLASGARISLLNDGTVNYIPNGQFDSLAVGETGIDTFDYTVTDESGSTAMATATITINGINDEPTALDDTARTDEESPINLNVILNDSDPDGDHLFVTKINDVIIEEGVLFSLPSGGSLTLESNGTLTFDPAGGYDFVAVGESAVETFEYSISDGNGGTATAEVNIVVDGINDPPVAMDDAAFEAMEDGPSAFYNITPGTPGQDFDVEGDISVVAINGTAFDDGNQIFLDSGAYIFMNSDGSVEYNANDAFHAELDLGETAIETINYTISDENGATDSATFQVAVIGQNDAPIANDDCSFGNTPGEDIVINVLANDVDIDGSIDPATMSIGSIDLDPATDGIQSEYIVDGQGTWTVNPDATVSFSPLPGLSGDPDPIYYSVADNHGLFGEPAQIEVSYFTADIWFANDLSGSVDATEYQSSLNLIADATNAVDFGSGTMAYQAGMISWAGTGEQNLDVALTSDKEAFISAVTNDTRDFAAYTDLAGAIHFAIDSIVEPSNGSRITSGVAQILTVMTDIHPDQLFNRDPYDDPRYPQNQVALIQEAAERAESLGITLAIVPIQLARTPEEIAFFESIASTDPDGNPLVYPAEDYDNIDVQTVAKAVEAIRLGSAPPGHEDCIVATPITIDFDNDGVIEYFPIEEGFRYDIDGDGQAEQMAWVGNDDAILVYDKDQNGDISNRSEFILSDWTKVADSDLEAVAAFFDSNQDGTFNEIDGEFDKFALWNDANGNSEVDEGEWMTLLDAGVIGFDVEGDGQYSLHAGGQVQVTGNTEFQMENGDALLAHDAAFHFRNTTASGEMLTSTSSNEPIVVFTQVGQTIAIESLPEGTDHDIQQIIAEPVSTTDSGDAASDNATFDHEIAAATAAAQTA